MNVYADAITGYLFVQGWQIALLALVVGAISFALRHKSAHIRYLLWLIVLAKCLMPPVYSVPVAVLPEDSGDDWLVPFMPSDFSAMSAADSEPSRTPAPVAKGPEVQPVALAAAPKTPPMLSRTEVAVLVWSAGVCGFFLWVGGRAVRYTSWLRSRRKLLPPDREQVFRELLQGLKFKTLPRIYLTEEIGQPFVWGLFRGSVYLPESFADLDDPQQCRTILSHELSHVARFDAAVNLLQVLVQAVYWFHPLIWWANRKIRVEREKCCDEMAVAQLELSPEHYTSAIVEALVQERRSVHPVPSLAIVGSLRDIEERIRTMMRPGRRFYRRPSVVVAMIVSALALITVPTALVLTVRAAAEVDMEPPHSAAFNGNITAVEQWLAQGGDVNVRNAAGKTLIRRALLGGCQDIIQLLEKHGADIDAEIQNDPSLIVEAATTGSPAGADRLISRGADRSHVYVASYLGKLDQVKAYIESGSQQVSADDKDQILLGAITGGHADIIEYILDHGADVHMSRVLNVAIGANRKQILELLIDKGADPNPGGNWAPLHETLWYYHPRLEMAKALLSHGADPFKGNWWSPMHDAIFFEKTDMVRLFLDYRRDTDLLPLAYFAAKENRKDVLPLFKPYVEISPIHLSCFYGKLDDVKSYLERGNDIEAQDIGGLSLLQFAVAGCQIEIADYLIAKGCNVNSRASDGASALHFAANSSDNSEEMVRRLIAAGALAEAKDNDNCTPFFYSATGPFDLGTAQALLNHGADINIQRKSDGATALHIVARKGPVNKMKWLIAKGADVNRRKEDGSTPLGEAIGRGRLGVAKYLLEHGADVNTQDKAGGTPLYYAARSGRKDIVEMLLRNGADITVVNTYDRTAMGEAEERGYTEIVELLSKRAGQLDPNKEIMTISDYAAIGDTEKIRSLIAAGHIQGEDGGKALSWASLRGHKEVAELLIQNGANVNHRGGNVVGWPLLHASTYGKKEIVELLLANGAETNVKSNEGDTPLDLARRRGYTEIVELLQKHGATE